MVMTSVGRRVEVLYVAALAATTVIQLTAWVILLLFFSGARQTPDSAGGAYEWGMVLSIGVAIAFAALKRVARRAEPDLILPRAAQGLWRNVLVCWGCLTIATVLLSAHLDPVVFGDAASQRVVAVDGGYFAYPGGGVRKVATLADYMLAQTLIAMVPVKGTIFCAGIFQLYLCADWVAPGYPLKAVFAPWRLRGRKERDPLALDAWSGS